MRCNDCQFRNEVLKLEEFSFPAIVAVCYKCGEKFKKTSIAFEIFQNNLDDAANTILALSSKNHSPEEISEITGIPLEFIMVVLASFS